MPIDHAYLDRVADERQRKDRSPQLPYYVGPYTKMRRVWGTTTWQLGQPFDPARF